MIEMRVVNVGQERVSALQAKIGELESEKENLRAKLEQYAKSGSWVVVET